MNRALLDRVLWKRTTLDFVIVFIVSIATLYIISILTFLLHEEINFLLFDGLWKMKMEYIV